jgi:hypothetical protein
MLDSVTFRHSPLRTPRYARLSFDSPVLAIGSVSRQRDLAWLYVLPIQRDAYPDSAADRFREDVLPRIRA